MSPGDAPHPSPDELPPVRMALRARGRHGHRGGPHLARAVAAARTPKHLAASTRLAHPGTGTGAAEPTAAPEAAEPHVPPGYEPPPFASQAPAAEIAREPAAPERPDVPGLTDFASEYLFGDAEAASAGLVPMAEAAKLPEPSREQRLAWRRARRAPDVSRAARILEGPAAGPP